MKRIALAGLMCGLLIGCDHQIGSTAGAAGGQGFHYHVTEDGSADTTDRTTYASIGEKSFSRVQKYRFTANSDLARRPHLLVMQVSQNVGKKSITRDVITFAPIKDGFYTYNCDHFYLSVPLSEPDDKIDDPTCTFKMVGVLPIVDQAIVDK